jgi:NAD(P)-dependent dehydrogenase (short-subunit alcohol dehydrogenase family)
MKELVAIVTGASQGIGRATAVRLAKDFAGIALAARNGEALKEVAAKVRSSGADPLILIYAKGSPLKSWSRRHSIALEGSMPC